MNEIKIMVMVPCTFLNSSTYKYTAQTGFQAMHCTLLVGRTVEMRNEQKYFAFLSF